MDKRSAANAAANAAEQLQPEARASTAPWGLGGSPKAPWGLGGSPGDPGPLLQEGIRSALKESTRTNRGKVARIRTSRVILRIRTSRVIYTPRDRIVGSRNPGSPATRRTTGASAPPWPWGTVFGSTVSTVGLRAVEVLRKLAPRAARRFMMGLPQLLEPHVEPGLRCVPGRGLAPHAWGQHWLRILKGPRFRSLPGSGAPRPSSPQMRPPLL